jgi:hypothetical protein
VKQTTTSAQVTNIITSDYNSKRGSSDFRLDRRHSYAEIREKLSIEDPGFEYQWHLVTNR